MGEPHMNKSMKAGALLIAGVFALSGCGSSDETATADSPASGSPSPTPTLAVGQEQYTADELEAALTAVKTSEGLTGEVENDAMLRPQLEETTLSGVVTTPEQCNILVSSFFDEKIAGGNLATVGLDSSDTLMLISYEDASVLEEQAGSSEQLIKDCVDFEMALDGAVITGAVEGLEASTDAPSTQAYRTVITRADGGEASTIQVSGLSGTLNLSVTLFDPADPDAAVAKAEETINAALTELEKE
ncbi:hypothetical protein OL239_14150 [Arthrobacter sp. ATA002]|uniref:hypothetical protein n=1 Tax=Arthrobacter sp. ATA002 TaxID=2991715 RepID=UPI0022A7757D|nr:hypothetical protein [Arthrobacter sp. ATA002]WAP51043.1 hypothetical protein OL239_14150 [Arthrobacter sp. ATA002]